MTYYVFGGTSINQSIMYIHVLSIIFAAKFLRMENFFFRCPLSLTAYNYCILQHINDVPESVYEK